MWHSYYSNLGEIMRETPKNHRHAAFCDRRFTLLELLVVVAVIALLAAFILPALSRSRQVAQASKCVTNLKNIGIAFTTYADSSSEFFPIGNAPGDRNWVALLSDYEKGSKIYYCSSDEDNSPVNFASQPTLVSYGYNLLALGFQDAGGKPHPQANDGTTVTEYAGALPSVREPAETLTAVDAGRASANGRGYYLATPAETLWPGDFVAWNRHQSRSNVLFVDGHVSPMTTQELVAPDQPGTNAAPINNYKYWSPIR